MPCTQHGLPIGERGLPLPRFIERQALDQLSPIQDGEIHRRTNGEEPRIPTGQVADLEGFNANSPFQSDAWVEIGFGHADGRHGSMKLRFCAQDVGPAMSQFGRNAYWHASWKRWQRHCFAQLSIQCTRLVAEQQGKSVHEGVAMPGQLRDRRLDRFHLRTRGRDLELRGDAVAPAAFRQAEKAFCDCLVLACNVQLGLRPP